MALLAGFDGSGMDHGDAVTVAGRTLSSEALLGCATAVADRVRGAAAVAVDASPSIEAVVGMVGAVRAGVPLVPLPPGGDERERCRILRESNAALVLGCADGRPSGGLPVVPVELGQRSSTHHPEPDPTADALILYTGGATGPPRGVRISRRAIATELDLLAEAWRWSAEDVLVQRLPLFRAYGLVVGLLGTLRVGGRLVHSDVGRTDAAPAGTMYLGLPRQWSRISREPAWARTLARARILVSADDPLPAPVAERLRALTTHCLVQGYGTTETLIAVTGRAEASREPDTTGLPLPGVETRVLDGDDQPVPTDGRSVGELSVRGPTLFSGYVDPVHGTGGAGAWHRTGDLATVCPDGSYRIIGRRHEVVHSGCRRIDVSLVEDVLLGHPGVDDAAVVGSPHPVLGEQVTAYVAARGLTAQTLIDHVGRHLSAHDRPRQVHFLDEIPRTALGRVSRSRLRAAG
ncbi:AMP-binding protein [Micromonospora sp. NPDC047074]|uniref:AMP-binding protein n=1 Tax=Micromonospora sp. NPDC047074 TaxID=3154339 RepID=UPI0033C13ECB